MPARVAITARKRGSLRCFSRKLTTGSIKVARTNPTANGKIAVSNCLEKTITKTSTAVARKTFKRFRGVIISLQFTSQLLLLFLSIICSNNDCNKKEAKGISLASLPWVLNHFRNFCGISSDYYLFISRNHKNFNF